MCIFLSLLWTTSMDRTIIHLFPLLCLLFYPPKILSPYWRPLNIWFLCQKFCYTICLFLKPILFYSYHIMTMIYSFITTLTKIIVIFTLFVFAVIADSFNWILSAMITRKTMMDGTFHATLLFKFLKVEGILKRHGEGVSRYFGWIVEELPAEFVRFLFTSSFSVHILVLVSQFKL